MRKMIPVLIVAALAAAPAFAVKYTWNTDASGDWYDSANWNPAGIPGGSANSVEIAREPMLDVIVTLRFSSGPNGVTVGPGNTLIVTTARGELNMALSPEGVRAHIQNDGQIVVTDYGYVRMNGIDLATAGQLTISGDGDIILGSGGRLATVNWGQMVLDRDETFGYGNVVLGRGTAASPGAVGGWDANLPFINRSEIYADGGVLVVDDIRNEPTPVGGVLQGGILGARDGGVLIAGGTIAGGWFLPGDGRVEIHSGRLHDMNIGAGDTRVTYHSTLYGTWGLAAGGVITVGPSYTLTLSGVTLVSDGVILVPSGATLSNSGGQASVWGNGTILLQGGALAADAAATNWIINQAGHTIRGRGVNYAYVANFGTLLWDDHTLTSYGALFGAGDLRIEGQDADNVAVLDYWNASALTTGSLSLNPFAKVILRNNKTINVSGDFSFAMTDETLWTLATRYLHMNGTGAWQDLEVGGEDRGPVAAGFTDNFSWDTLHVEPGANVSLVDLVDNGNRHSPEALYVKTLVVDEGATLNLNGIRLYTNLTIDGTLRTCMIDDGNYPDYERYIDGRFTVVPAGVPAAADGGITLLPNVPNPFNPATVIAFELPREARAALDIYDVAGRRVGGTEARDLAAGRHEYTWHAVDPQGRGLPSGVYLAQLRVGDKALVRKLTLLR